MDKKKYTADVIDKEELLNHMEENDIKHLGEYNNASSRVEGNGAATVAIVNSTGESIFTQLLVLDNIHDIEQHKIIYDEEGNACYEQNGELNYLEEFMRLG